jgi:hypothetical protein
MSFSPIRWGKPTEAVYAQKAMGNGKPIVQRRINGGNYCVIVDSLDNERLLNDLYEITDSTVREDQSQPPPGRLHRDAEVRLMKVYGKHTVHTLARASNHMNSSIQAGLGQLSEIIDLAASCHAAMIDWKRQTPASLDPLTQAALSSAGALERAETARRIRLQEALKRTSGFQTRGRSGRPQNNPGASALVFLMIERLAYEQHRIDSKAFDLTALRQADSFQLLIAVEHNVDQILNATKLPLNDSRKRSIHQHARSALVKPYHFAYYYLGGLTRSGELLVMADGRQLQRHEVIHRAYTAERQLANWGLALSVIKRNYRQLAAHSLEEIRDSLPIDGFDAPQAAIGLRVLGKFEEMYECLERPSDQRTKAKEIRKLASEAQALMRDRIFFWNKAEHQNRQYKFAALWLPPEVQPVLSRIPNRPRYRGNARRASQPQRLFPLPQ